MSDTGGVKNPLIFEDLYAAFAATDSIVLKKYIATLSDAPCTEIPDILKTVKIGSNVALYRVANIVYDKNENIQDKLTTVYSTVFSLKNCGLVMLINGHKKHVDLFVGVVTKDLLSLNQNGEDILVADEKTLINNGKVLRNAFLGNFPGTELNPVNKVTVSGYEEGQPVDYMGKKDVICSALKNVEYISAVSSIPALRNIKEYKNQEFVQGLEKFIDTLRGKEYSAIIIADAMGNDRIEEMCAEYEDLYSQLAPFKSSSHTVSSQKSVTDTESIIKGVTDTTNELIAKSLSHGTAASKTHTDSVGISGSVGFEKKPFTLSANYSHSNSRTKTESEAITDTKSTGTAKSLTEQNSVAKSLSSSDGEAIQLTYENKTVSTLMERINEQIVRLRSCEDFGLFDTCAYFAAKEHDIVVAAASAFKSLTRGENSSVESSAVNVWEKESVEHIKEYLMRFYHPEFLTVISENHQYSTTATMLISGKEMAYQMPLPRKSVSGVPVVECVEFGREVLSLSPKVADISLGRIFHMHKEEENEVKLSTESMASHTFITGSTGSGKSTTIYKILDELATGNIDKSVRFMVVEPAKGEYKNALAKNIKYDIRVYGTNPNITKLLKINPFKFPAEKIHIYEHMDKLTEIFNVCWPMYAAMPAVLKAAIENAYRSAGWNLVKSENKHGDIYPSFVDVAIEVEKYINKSEYSAENKSNYKGSLLTRLESLTNGINSMIFSSDDIDDEDLFENNVIIDLSRVGSSETKSLIMGLLILKLQEYRIATAKESNSCLKHITVLEEAHNLLKRTSTEQNSESSNLLGKSVEMLANSIAEMRTYGEGFIIADQSPGLLDMSAIRNTNTKIIMRLPDFSDRELVGKAAGLNTEQIAELSKLPQGVAAVYQNDWINPVLCKVRKPEITEDVFEDKESIRENCDVSLLFDLLDSDFRAKLDDTDGVECFKTTILKSSLPTKMKLKLVDYLEIRQSAESVKRLAAVLFDYFKNTKDVLERSLEENTVEDLKSFILAELKPSVMDYDDEQVNLLIALVMKEYMDRYHMDYPLWNEFASCIKRGEII